MKNKSGFTMIELCCVIAIIATLMSTVMPMYKKSIQRTKETALKQDLHTFRKLISEYYKDNDRWPKSLEELVKEGYMRAVPEDPITQSKETWVYVPSDDDENDLYDVKSGAKGETLDGIKYSEL